MGRHCELWYSADVLESENNDINLEKLKNSKCSGIVLNTNQFTKYSKLNSLTKIVKIENEEALNHVNEVVGQRENKKDYDNIIYSSSNVYLLDKIKHSSQKTCLNAYVDDSNNLIEAINNGKYFDFLNIKFKDPTNIPLELVLAKLQSSNTKVIKEIDNSDEITDAKVVFGVMQIGVDGILFSPTKTTLFETVNNYIKEFSENTINILPGEIRRSEFIGMGHRSCIDLTTIFTEHEGMLIGSTSDGGILCCAEVFHLPYMDKRPFRVNAGGVHSYVFNVHDTTNYITELKSGSTVMVIDTKGNTRKAQVGRIKTEIRPLRLIEVMFDNLKTVNIIMQDDWHVRVFSADEKPANITELKLGDKVLGYATEPGRHVGIRINEYIKEQ